jgi:N-acetyl-gamma-glutamyl-phosphate reductase
LLPISRGILSTIYASLSSTISEQDIQTLYESAYNEDPFVRVYPAGTVPVTQHVRGSNCCDIGVKVDARSGRVMQ